MSVAQGFLLKLLERAQSAQSRGQSEQITLLLSPAQCPDYFAMRDLAEAEQFRAELAVAERRGGIVLQVTSRQPPPRDVEAATVADISVLAAHLGIELRTDQVGQARTMLAAHGDEYPVIHAVLDSWAAGRKARGKGPSADARNDLLAAVQVMQARRGKTDEVLMRRLSAHLFQDTKRIEKLGLWLDVLYAGELSPSGLESSEVFSALGLHKEPQPLLIAADATAIGSSIQSRLFRPYHGLPMSSIDAFRFEGAPACLLTVENKQTFHELAALAVDTRSCVVFTGGMPSPAWHRVYAKVLQAIPAQVPVYHFGDLDVGGFRIAHAIGQTAMESGRSLLPWLMDPVDLVQRGHALYAATNSQVTAMRDWCQRIGWNVLADRLGEAPGLLEQEIVSPVLPVVQGTPT